MVPRSKLDAAVSSTPVDATVNRGKTVTKPLMELSSIAPYNLPMKLLLLQEFSSDQENCMTFFLNEY